MNQYSFKDKIISGRTVVSIIIFNVSLSGNNSNKTANSSTYEFAILKSFKVIIKPPEAPTIKELFCSPPLPNWVKCNTDGATIGKPCISFCGGIFSDSDTNFLGCFAEKLPLGNAFNGEISDAIRAIEIASDNNWNSLGVRNRFSASFVSF